MGSILGGFVDTGLTALMHYWDRTSNTKDSPNEHHATTGISGGLEPSEEPNHLSKSAPNTMDTFDKYYLTKFYLYEEDYRLDRLRSKLAELSRNSATSTNMRGTTATVR